MSNIITLMATKEPNWWPDRWQKDEQKNQINDKMTKKQKVYWVF